MKQEQKIRLGRVIVCLLLALCFVGTALASGSTLVMGDKGDEVLRLQQQLRALGYYQDALNSKFDRNTRDAVKLYQTANGLKNDGKASEAVLTLLASGKSVTAAEYNRICPLKSGNKGEAVKELQRQLIAIEFYDGPIDGKYDSDVSNAVKAFQTANGLKVNGSATTPVREKMISGQCVTGATYNLVCALKSGNSGIAVKVLQRQMQALGYYSGALDGKYSSALRNAVKTFQTANSLKATGKADAGTRTLVNSGKSVTAAEYDRVRPLKSGNKGEAVLLLQNQLKQMGYYTGALDGKYASALRDAVKTFQTANSLKATGTADVSTRTLINGGKCVTAAQYDLVRPLTSSSKGEAVRMVQRQLNELGYYVYSVNGKYDKNTRNATKVFQTANHLKATGYANVETRALLNSKKGISRQAYDATRTLKKGDLGSTVLAMQNRLIQLGYMSGTADGIFQNGTRTALKLFQTAHNLSDTGTATVETRAVLMSNQAISYADYLEVCPIKSGESGESVRQVQRQLQKLGYYMGALNGRYSSDMREAVKLFQQANGFTVNPVRVTLEMRQALNAGQIISLETYYKTTTLSSGDRGDAVGYLQNRLIELGYYTGRVNCVFGSDTEKAVRLFQTANSLTVTGVANGVTRAVMNSSQAITKEQYDRLNQGSSNDQKPVDPESAQKIEKLIKEAQAKLGSPYVLNTSGPSTFDCSGFTKYCFQTVGITLSGASYNQGYLDKESNIPHQKITSISALKRGDLLVFDNNNGDNDKSDHLGIYLGNGEFIHASSSKAMVVVSNLNSYLSSGYSSFSWAFRLL